MAACSPGLAGPGHHQECGGGSGHFGAWAWWGRGGQRQVESARILYPGQTAVAPMPAREDLFFTTTINCPEEEEEEKTQ